MGGISLAHWICWHVDDDDDDWKGQQINGLSQAAKPLAVPLPCKLCNVHRVIINRQGNTMLWAKVLHDCQMHYLLQAKDLSSFMFLVTL